MHSAEMATPFAYVALGFLLAFAPALCRLAAKLIRRPELYAHDREARLLNLAPPDTRWMNLGRCNTASFPARHHLVGSPQF